MEQKKKQELPKIDFIVLWVDNEDVAWQKEKEYWKNNGNRLSAAANDVRYRDWGLFKYWFRCVEQNAPWVRKIHLVTNGQIPKWLNMNHPKLQLDTHASFMSKESLPTFSSHPIELQLHKINDLSEHFVYFNDDMFLINAVTEDFFFRGNDRADYFCEREYLRFTGTEFSKILHADINAINENICNKREIIKNVIGLDRWFSKNLSLSYRLSNLINYIRSKKFIGFSVEHTASAFTKSLMNDVWVNFNRVLSDTITHKFRTETDVNQYLFRYWSFIKGEYFLNEKMKGGYYTLNEIDKALDAINGNSHYPIICINDADNVKFNPDKVKLLQVAFEKRFKTPSSFERQ